LTIDKPVVVLTSSSAGLDFAFADRQVLHVRQFGVGVHVLFSLCTNLSLSVLYIHAFAAFSNSNP
jgi:hypothetical protein